MSTTRHIWRIALVLLAVAGAVALYRQRGAWQTPEQLLAWGAGYGTAALIVAIIAATLTCGLSASAFLIVTPLLFAPHWSAAITTAGFALGTAGGYTVARLAGGAWVAARFRDRRMHKFLQSHSSFLALFGVRLIPASPHSLISYAAGLAAVPLPRLLAATLAALAIKSYVYALAVHQAMSAGAGTDAAVGVTTLLSLLAVGALALLGHLIKRRYFRNDLIGNQLGKPVSLEES
ncbi:MAG: VTT domain-containing protein [Acidobacteria bacterium]|nr:VTT domain-containing protein [Acidobacteriota bacterium]